MDKGRLSVRENRVLWRLGDAGCNIILAIMLFVGIFIRIFFGLAPALVGVYSVRVIDAVTTESGDGRAPIVPKVNMVVSALATVDCISYALFSVLMFTRRRTGAITQQVVYAFVTYFLLCDLHRHQYSLMCSLGGVITNDPKERVACRAYRFVLKIGIATLLLC